MNQIKYTSAWKVYENKYSKGGQELEKKSRFGMSFLQTWKAVENS